MTATTLLLVRHGETVWHADNRYAGAASDIDLTDRGRHQAAALAEWAVGARIDAVVASPVRRALETARPVASALGLPLDVVDELREVSFGVAEGRTAEELHLLDATMFRRFREDPAAHPFPGSESAGMAASRAETALRAVAAKYPATTVLIVAHNTLLRLGLCALLELPVQRYRHLFPRLDNAAVTEVSVPEDAHLPAGLLRLNAPITAAVPDHLLAHPPETARARTASQHHSTTPSTPSPRRGNPEEPR